MQSHSRLGVYTNFGGTQGETHWNAQGTREHTFSVPPLLVTQKQWAQLSVESKRPQRRPTQSAPWPRGSWGQDSAQSAEQADTDVQVRSFWVSFIVAVRSCADTAQLEGGSHCTFLASKCFQLCSLQMSIFFWQCCWESVYWFSVSLWLPETVFCPPLSILCPPSGQHLAGYHWRGNAGWPWQLIFYILLFFYINLSLFCKFLPKNFLWFWLEKYQL